ncbi:receptor-type tyrosine-protein phosphatase alpha-like isoform X2 [Corticium candelabrum]|uniref:receptor-type tyrosine-protein phosphatase alpha-like isoform X2 n=1 Tax=Corticium candelabrum TaxID=121492 RepID=UPI002E259744|nr:receptor-type tyrosine-protein phosphatase alpha-like isoform X2 [Corticium candelabrum]
MTSQVTSTSALITWQQPRFTTPRSVSSYYIRYFKSTRPDEYPQSTRKRRVNLTNLDIYTNYTIDIAAYVSPLLSTYYASYNFTTKQAAPSPPQKVKANDIRSRSVSISWTPPLHANGVLKKYRIYIQSYHTSRLNNLNNGNKTVSQSEAAVTIDKLIPFTTYYVWVTAINVDGRELESDFERPTVFETNAEASSPPREVQWFNVTSHSVIVLWRKPATVHGNVEKYSVSLVSFLKQTIVKKVLAKKHENSLFLFVDNLVPYTQYTVTVQAGTRTNCCSNLLWSDANIDESTVTFTTQQAAPSQPARPNATNVLSRSCLIKWKLPDAPNGDIQFYLLSLYKKADNIDSSISHNMSNIDTFRHLAKNSTLQMELSSLSPYTSYGAAVTAVNIMNNTELKSKQSELVNFTTADEKPGAPSMCTVNRRGVNSIFMSWQPPEPHDYKVVFYYVKVNSTTTADSKNHSKIVSHLSDNVSNLLPYTEYKITVTAVTNNTQLWEGFPCYLKDKTKVGVPPVPEKLLLPVNMTEKGSTITVTLPQLNKTNGPIKVVKIIALELKPNTDWFENMSLPRADDDRVHAYTTINLTTDQVKEQVVIGSDNYGYGPLKPNTKYAFYVQWISEDKDSTGRRIQLISTSAGIVYTTDSFGSTASSSSSHVAPIVVVLLLVAIVTAVVVVVIWYRRRKAKKRDLHGQDRYTVQSKDIALQAIPTVQSDGQNGELAYKSGFIINSVGRSNEFENHIEKLSADDNDGFITEFEELASIGINQSTAIARKNAEKNRYKNIVPYDDYLVELGEVYGMDKLESEYINATYIDGFSRKNQYIVTQGPLPSTCADFWRMVWLERTEFIVMVTQVIESGKKKCFRYWSDSDTKVCDGLTVEVVLVVEMADYTVRTMKLQVLDEEHTVTHYHFKSWPDHGVPSYATDLLGLMFRVRRDSRHSTTPVIIHCSAGVGRSGTYVTIDTLIDCLDSQQEIDVKSTVTKLRMRRMDMVQSVLQYILIHNAVLEMNYTKKTEIPVSDYTNQFAKLLDVCPELPNCRKIKKEFDVLTKLSPTLDKSAFKIALLPTVRKRKNRDSQFIPPDTVRVILHCDGDSVDADYVNTEEGADYINASYVNGYHKRDLYIVTQAPLANTVADLWKMTFEQNVNAIVNLAQPHEFDKYWPDSGSQKFGRLTVNYSSLTETNSFKVYKLELTKGQSSYTIALFHYPFWPNDAYPSDVTGLIELMSQLDQWMKSVRGNRMIVHCCTGMGRTGVFCAVNNILDQMKSEGVANVLHVTRVLLDQRPRIIQTPEQYETVYSVIDRYQQSESIYSNVK